MQYFDNEPTERVCNILITYWEHNPFLLCCCGNQKKYEDDPHQDIPPGRIAPKNKLGTQCQSGMKLNKLATCCRYARDLPVVSCKIASESIDRCYDGGALNNMLSGASVVSEVMRKKVDTCRAYY